jgi:hypothetical protein
LCVEIIVPCLFFLVNNTVSPGDVDVVVAPMAVSLLCYRSLNNDDDDDVGKNHTGVVNVGMHYYLLLLLLGEEEVAVVFVTGRRPFVINGPCHVTAFHVLLTTL